MHTIYLLKKVRKFHWFFTKSISAIYLKGLSPTKDAVTHSTVAFPDPVVHHTWVSVYRGSSGYTLIAISQGKTNVTQMWRESETQLLESWSLKCQLSTLHTIYLLKKVRKFHWFFTKSISAIYLKGLSPTKDAVTHSTVAFPDPVVHHTWVSVYRGSSGYTLIAISQGKTNVTQMWRESETQLLESWSLILEN